MSCLRCSKCGAELCLKAQIISKGFTGRHGRAYLVSAEPTASAVSMSGSTSQAESLPNTVMQRPVPRQYVTGLHTVCDISCAFCGSVLGWKYVSAEEESQRYKVGKFILETKQIAMSSSWESPCNTNQPVSPGHLSSEPSENINCDEHIGFDSQDEDECEDICWDMESEFGSAPKESEVGSLSPVVSVPVLKSILRPFKFFGTWHDVHSHNFI